MEAADLIPASGECQGFFNWLGLGETWPRRRYYMVDGGRRSIATDGVGAMEITRTLEHYRILIKYT